MAASMTRLGIRGAAAALLGASVMAMAVGATAQGFHPPPPAETSVPTHEYVSDASLTQMFTSLCLKAFPDAAAVDAALKLHSLSPLTPEQARPYFSDGTGTGKGWLVRTSDALFAVTIEEAPNQTCAVRQMTPDGLRDIAGLTAAIRAHVIAMKGKVVAVAPEKASLVDGPETRYWGYGVLTADSTPVEQFGIYVSDYKGKVPLPWTPFAGKGSGVEVRFTRTILAG